MAISLKQSINNLLGRDSVKRAKWRYLFTAMLACLLVMEALVVRGSVKLVLSSRDTPEVQKNKGVRINFKDYDEAVRRIEKGKSFEPTAGVGADPFTGQRIQNAGLLEVPAEGTSTSTAGKTATTTGE